MKSWSIIAIILLFGNSFNLLSQDKILSQNFSSAGTSLDAATNTLQHLFSAIGQPIAVGNIDPVATQAGFLHLANYIVVIIDEDAPLITYETPNQKLTENSPTTLELQIQDYNPISEAKIHYRPIGGNDFLETNLTRVSVGNYSIQIQTSWNDAMGLEYYFTAKDGAQVPNSARSPEEGNYFAYLPRQEVSIPVTSFGSSITNYRMVSMPYTTTNNAVTSLFEELGEYKDSQWRMATYVNESDKFIEYPGEFTTMERGKGYWLIIKNTTQLSIGPVDPPEENATSLYQVTLKPGWNMIGNPYPVSIKWSNVLSLNDDPAISSLQTYSGGWDVSDVLPPYQGGFVNYGGQTTLKIDIPMNETSGTGGRISDNKPGINIDENSWKIDLNIFQGDTYNKIGGFGMSPEANDQIDFYDGFNPPRFLDAPEIIFNSPLSFKNQCLDMVESKGEYTWQFKTKAVPGKSARLQWDEIPDGIKELYLFDEEQLNIIDMRSLSNYSFIQIDRTYSFKIFYGDHIKDKLMPEELLVGQPFPNPGEKEKIRIKIALPSNINAYDVCLDLIDLQGRTISQDTKKMISGVNEVELKSDVAMVSGIYFYRLKITNLEFDKLFTGKLIVK